MAQLPTAVIVVFALLFIVVLTLLIWTRIRISESAQRQFESWQRRELETYKRQFSELAQREALVSLEQWKVAFETEIRKDAINRSQAIIAGKVSEHLIPYMPIFPYNPKDARFIGSPIDIIVFDGADEEEVKQVIFLEIKTGTSALSTRQKQIRDAVQAARVFWREFRV